MAEAKSNRFNIQSIRPARISALRVAESWKLRPYRPDYGLDFALEVFEDFPPDANRFSTEPDLGEHIFIQLKSSKEPDLKAVRYPSPAQRGKGTGGLG